MALQISDRCMTLLDEMWPSETLQGLKALLRQSTVEKTYAYGF